MFTGYPLNFLDDDEHFIEYELRGVGTGHSKSGIRKKWKKKHYFEQDLLTLSLRELGADGFASKFCGCSVNDILYIWNNIKKRVLRAKETEIHARNKLLLWLDKLHNDLKWKQIKSRYQIGIKTAVDYVDDILNGIIDSYKNTNVISFPTEQQKLKMVKMNKLLRKPMPHALFTMDGKHARCFGAKCKKRLSYKYKFIPCFNVLFLIERAFGTVCAFNLDEHTSKHDITILRESSWFQNLEELTNGWIVMADKGYIGHDASNIAACLRSNMSGREKYSPQFWEQLKIARSDSERVFAQFFFNKFYQLANWKGKGVNSFKDWALNVTCCIIIYNELKIRNVKLC